MSPDALEHLTIQKLDDAYRVERDAIYEAKRKLDQRARKNAAMGYAIRYRRDRLAATVNRMPPVTGNGWRTGGTTVPAKARE